MISAIVVAAGLSRRMGQFKLLMPWRGTTVIGQVVATLEVAGLSEILVVTGHHAPEVAGALAGGAARTVYNADFARGEMISSVRAGLSAVRGDVAAALLCLGDQPQIQSQTVAAVLAAGAKSDHRRIIVPSYQMRTGHPIVLPRAVWPAVFDTPQDLRAVMERYRAQIDYVSVDTPTILADLDTPDDYHAADPEG